MLIGSAVSGYIGSAVSGCINALLEVQLVDALHTILEVQLVDALMHYWKCSQWMH